MTRHSTDRVDGKIVAQCPECGHEHREQVSEPCQMNGCPYPAEFEGWCKWCYLTLETDAVLDVYPELESIA